MTYALRPQAIEDLEAIVTAIAADNPGAAQKWLARMGQIFENLGTMPEMGAPRFDVRENMRLYPVGNYLILYQSVAENADIVRIIHGARDWAELL